MLDLINELAEENKQLKNKKRTKYIHQHIIRITYPYQTDVEDTEHMIKNIQSIIMNETGIEPTIEEYLLWVLNYICDCAYQKEEQKGEKSLTDVSGIEREGTSDSSLGKLSHETCVVWS